MDNLSGQIPALREYLARIGAEEVNFRRFVVRTPAGNGYSRDVAYVRLLKDGTLKCSSPEHEPTKDEAKAIYEAYLKVDIPHEIGASPATVKVLEREIKSKVFAFWSRASGEARMCQQRIDTRDGGKAYVPWTYWSDAKWRMMEPEGPLPFWKPNEPRQKSRLMVHEGAKAAAFCDELVNSREGKLHPWFADLCSYEHWGMIGGAPNGPSRADYDELRSFAPQLLVYVCDHDFEGEAALARFSNAYGGKMRGLKFASTFPGGFDLADPFPEDFFEDGVYSGPKMEELIVPATRATNLVLTGEKGRPAVALRRNFREEWVHTVRPDIYIHRDWPHKLWTAAEFDDLIRPYSDAEQTSKLLRADESSKVEFLRYRPGDPPGVSGGDKDRFLNTYHPPLVVPEEGDVEPFVDFTRRLVVDVTDWFNLMRWCATLIARPDIRMQYGVLLISETQGVGKGTLGEKILLPLVGKHNVVVPSEKVVTGKFTGWVAHKRLAVVHEIYAGYSSKAYDELKSIITDQYIEVEMKFENSYTIENFVHMFACSNSKRALKISLDDRRWFVPHITGDKQPVSYWRDLNHWLTRENGLAHVFDYFIKFAASHRPVLPGDNAPSSSIKREMVVEGYSQGMGEVHRLLMGIKSILDGNTVEDEKKREEWKRRGMLKDGAVITTDFALIQYIRNNSTRGGPTPRSRGPPSFARSRATPSSTRSRRPSPTATTGSGRTSTRPSC